jgi:cytoskeletal protein CcmA (bactofilin family)
MLPKKQRKKMLRQLDTLIGQHTQIKGNLLFDGGLRIDGALVGNIASSDDPNAVLTLSEVGSIEGDIHVPNMIINGSITGNLHSSGHLELAANTKITGNVYYNLLQIEEGAEINGSLIHVKADDAIIGFEQDDEKMMLASHDN